jgi:hypothetical protein
MIGVFQYASQYFVLIQKTASKTLFIVLTVALRSIICPFPPSF